MIEDLDKSLEFEEKYQEGIKRLASVFLSIAMDLIESGEADEFLNEIKADEKNLNGLKETKQPL
jgi:hypothetical protein